MLIETTETAGAWSLPALVEARAEGLSRGPSRRSPCVASSMWTMGTHEMQNLPSHTARSPVKSPPLRGGSVANASPEMGLPTAAPRRRALIEKRIFLAKVVY